MSSTSVSNIKDWRRDPRLVEVEALSRTGRLGEAITRASALEARGVDHPLVLNLVAFGHRQAGRLDAAIATVRRALAAEPDNPALLMSLGNYYLAGGFTLPALEAFDAALKVAPTAVVAVSGRARALLRLGDLKTAEPVFRHALAIHARHVDALGGLAVLLNLRGDHLGAAALARRALGIDPGHLESVMVLAEAANAERRFAEAEALLRPVLTRSDAPPLERGSVSSLLGDALHGQGRFDEAFQAYRSAAGDYRQVNAPEATAARAEGEGARAQRLTRYFQTAAPEPWRRPAPGEASAFPAHLFLVGFPRSGTSLLENVFAAHPRVTSLDEVPTLTQAIDAFFGADADLDRLAALDAETADACRRTHAERVRAVAPTAGPDRLLLEKMPLFTLFLPILPKLFPRAKVLFALRDPRDVVLSCFRRRILVRNAGAEFMDLQATADYYDQVMALAQTYIERLSFNLMLVRNEDLIDDFDEGARKICGFAGLDWSEQMRAFADTAKRRDLSTPSANQVRQGLNAGGVGQWRAYRDQMAPVLPRLAPWVERFGYPAD
jgi:tetratricopeptide (TPR) repeat protein